MYIHVVITVFVHAHMVLYTADVSTGSHIKIGSAQAHDFLTNSRPKRNTDPKWYRLNPDFQSYYRFYNSIGHIEGVSCVWSETIALFLNVLSFLMHFRASQSDLRDRQDQDVVSADAVLWADLWPRCFQLPKCSGCTNNHSAASYYRSASTTSHNPCSYARPSEECSKDLSVPSKRSIVQTSGSLFANRGCSSIVWPASQPHLHA